MCSDAEAAKHATSTYPKLLNQDDAANFGVKQLSGPHET